MQPVIQRQKLFVASCLALLVTSLSFGIRAGIINQLGTEFGLDYKQLAAIVATAFWGFPIAVVIGGMIVDAIGIKRLLVVAFCLHLMGILFTIFSGGFWSLYISTLFIGLANGTVEAACNPLVATLYPENKTTRLNYFHLWFPGGIVIGTLIVRLFGLIGLEADWQFQVGLMIIPTLIYGYLFLKQPVPVTERVASGISAGSMIRSIFTPLFLFMFICMIGTAITELFTNQWTDVLFKEVTHNALLILTLVASVQVVGRAFASPLVHRLAPEGVLLMSAILSTLGIYLMIHAQGLEIFGAAIVFGLGVAFFWPCMIGFVAEYIPSSGALGINILGGIGMFAVSLYTGFMGGKFDQIMVQYLPAGANLNTYASSTDPHLKAVYDSARAHAGPEILKITNIIPLILIVAFTGLVIYMKNRKRVPVAARPSAI
ncbi:MAG TPA: MFS transporter [Chitinophagaceae bacterium]|nr:MFS transporter [Chitinophagaceae bacterium]